MESLPNEIVLEILAYFDISQLAILKRVSKTFQQFINTHHGDAITKYALIWSQKVNLFWVTFNSGLFRCDYDHSKFIYEKAIQYNSPAAIIVDYNDEYRTAAQRKKIVTCVPGKIMLDTSWFRARKIIASQFKNSKRKIFLVKNFGKVNTNSEEVFALIYLCNSVSVLSRHIQPSYHMENIERPIKADLKILFQALFPFLIN